MPHAINPHQHLLEQQLPAWARELSPAHWRHLQQALTPAQGLPDAQAAWFANAAPDLRETVVASQARLFAAERALARSLKGLKQISEFAEPLLGEHLRDAFGLDSSVRDAQLMRIYRTFTWQTYVSHHERESLLHAALHYFTEDVTFSRDSAVALARDIQVKRCVVVGQTTFGDQDTLVDIELDSETYAITPLQLAPQAFARACRELDLGQRYQEHLDALFTPAPVRHAFMAMCQARLRLDADVAFMRNRVTATAVDAVAALVESRTTLPSLQLSLFGITLHEALLLDLGSAGLLLHLPGHKRALRQASHFDALHDDLCSDLLDPLFRQQFLAYVPTASHAEFIDRLRQNLDAAGDTPLDQAWPLRADASLYLARCAIDGDPFAFAYHDHLARLKAQARLVAVPTAEVDEQARKRRIAQWESAGLNALMIAGAFIPGVGTLMLGVVACQLLDEVYEGYQAWGVGDRHLALRHLEAVGLNLAVIGGLHAAGKVLPKLFNSPLMEGLDPVAKADGSQRLWRADLAGYGNAIELPSTLQPNALGQYAHEGTWYIRMDGQLYAQGLDSDTGRWRIVHPSDQQAYQPVLEHNGDGAWWCEHEAPQDWSDSQLVRRLGLALEALDDRELGHALKITGVDRCRLQAIYLAGAPTPVLLADTLERMKLAKQFADLPPAALMAAYEYPPNLAEQKLRDAFAHLSTPLAARLLARLCVAEQADWVGTGTLPNWLRAEAEQANADLPLSRALEGLYVPGLANTESDRLVLACLERQPQWPAALRLEIRANSPDGPLLMAIGSESASQRCLLLKSAQGFEAYRGERPVPDTVHGDLYQAVFAAAPAPLKAALGDVETLQARIRHFAETDRQAWPARLWGIGAKRTPLRLRLAGGKPTNPLPPPSLSHNAWAGRLRRLFPTFTQEQVDRTLADWQRHLRSPEVELLNYETRLRRLRSDLNGWAALAPHRQRAIAPIVNAWRRNSIRWLNTGERIACLNLTDLHLENHDLATLSLPDGFTHVEDLDLSGNPSLSEVPSQWFQRMPGLRRLTLARCRFARLPHLPEAGELNWLDMERNRITWDEAAQIALQRLDSLRVLDLSDNPLLSAPDISRLSNLRSLFMVNCSLTRLPQGLERLESAAVVDLSDNPLQRLPRDFTLPRETANVLCLESESLSLPIREQIEEYYQLHGVDLLVSDTDYQPLLSGASAQRQQLWLRLPLQYRRDLRALIEDLDSFDDPAPGFARLWRRLERLDRDATFREMALMEPASSLLDL
ncbi:hypothetical protein JET76_10835 [Pseudomonas putida]|uniref:dermonecrotic toxin domain-containing protein n=1 Tax=Pseudomonas putida TaxID=303 RepID=UPI000DB517A2|nr:DUF6543 domain-containing protein [Pseudomonas putida]MBI6941835.1 hypothetical protein [Pseudomonas putida]MBI6958094.1 hypothetical protein [Pseudomonas putida]PZQ41443.1 MAG: hypothetical protein DI560_06370 [Pseudomonas putida]